MFIRSLILTALSCFCISSVYATTLQEGIAEALKNNLVIQKRLRNFRVMQQDLDVAESEYYPSINLGAAQYKREGEIKSAAVGSGSDCRNYEISLTVTQNIFDGFETTHKVNFEEAQILETASQYLEKSNDIAFQISDVYIKVLRFTDLVGIAQENVQINESMYLQVKDLFESGLVTNSEVKKIQTTLSLARSNLTVQKNNARDAQYQYRRVLGSLPDVTVMQKPDLDIKLPSTVKRAALYAIENNPSLLVRRYNILSTKFLPKQRKKDFYPRINLEISQTLNSKRQIVEGLDLSWNAYYMIKNKLRDLKNYSKYSQKRLELYKKEYDLGRCSLLDLLSAQNEVMNSRSQIIQAEYDQLFAKYRILDAMGLLVVALNGTAAEFTSKVNLYVDDNDQDGVFNDKDSCLNTPLGYSVDESGCTTLVIFSTNFQQQSAELSADLDEKIGEFSDFLKKYPELHAKIVGHTSKTKVSREVYNLKLSKMRAQRVKKELVKYGVDTQRLTTEGKGFLEPIADNDTLDGRTLNRRVEILIIREEEK